MEIALNNRKIAPEQVYAGLPDAWLTLLAEKRGVVFLASATPAQKRQSLVDILRQPVVYDTWTTPELSTAVVGRGIQKVCNGERRARFISILEKRDADPNADGNSPLRFEKLVSGPSTTVLSV